MMIPLDFKHFDRCSSSTSFLGIQDFDWKFLIRKIWLDVDTLYINDFGRNTNTFLELRYMEDVMNGC
jgi:hypothetical protein